VAGRDWGKVIFLVGNAMMEGDEVADAEWFEKIRRMDLKDESRK
jgi:hypothetical protein